MYTKRFVKPLLVLLIFSGCLLNGYAQDNPNIIWIFAEDPSPWIGCYGDHINEAATPNIDAIGNAGVIFKRAFVPAPVCSACRSAMMVGQSAIRFGGHEHRSSRRPPDTQIYLPDGYKLLPQIMKENGYTTFNNGKTDYNFIWDPKAVYSTTTNSKTDFTELKDKQPFFGQIQTRGGKSNTNKLDSGRKVNPKDVTVPADYPDNQIYKELVAQHYDAIRTDDDLIGSILKGLKDAGLDKNTIVVYFSDHGANHLLRHKQMTTEGGLHVPFVIMGPEQFVPKKQVRNDLVNMIDLTASTLAWAGINQPDWYEGQNLFADSFQERNYVGAQKDRLDHTIDRVRTIRTDKFRYVRNYKLDRILLQPQYRDNKDYTKNLHELYETGQLSATHKEIYFGERQAEELYDVSVDPEMVFNLVNDPAYKRELKRHRKLLSEWMEKGDKGIEEEEIASLKVHGEDKPYGEGVNIEYEEYRVDSDGDGLSDKWEILNNRDPEDGLTTFAFDCGGWQTEGWSSKDIKSNLAGYLGFLDFELNRERGAITRDGLKVIASDKDVSLEVKLRATKDIQFAFSANDREVGSAKVIGGEGFKAV
ncbi:hypothetical protein LCGC14_2154610, partial [marine sediment metagenome]